MEELFNELFNFDEYRYFYHVTGHGVSDKVMEEGLLMAEKEYYTTMIEITPDMIGDPETFLKDEKGFGVMQRDEMVIIRVPKSLGYNFVESLESKNDLFEDDNNASFVPSDYILGYFDLDNFGFTYNDYVKGEDDDYVVGDSYYGKI